MRTFEKTERAHTVTPIASVDHSVATRWLTLVLSVIAGSVDTIGFLGLAGLFTAHITGNLVILATRFLAGGPTPIAHVISVPVFVVVLALTTLSSDGLRRLGIASLGPLLLLHFVLLSAFLAVGLAAHKQFDPNSLKMLFAGMLGVSAMAVQNALVSISLAEAPSTAVMTTNITVFTIDAVNMLLARDPLTVAKARHRASRTWPAIIGFLLGCVLGGVGEVMIGLRFLIFPTGLALIAVALGALTHPQPPESLSQTGKENPQ